MGYTRTENPLLYTSLVKGDVPPLSQDLFKAFWVNLADLKIYSAKYNNAGALELVSLDLPTISKGASGISSLAVDLPITGDISYLGGNTFTPPITSQPKGMEAVQFDGVNGLIVNNLIAGFKKNGEYYDIIIAQLDEAFPGVIVSVRT